MTMKCKVVPYTDEDGTPDPNMAESVMLFIGENVDEPEHCLDSIPAAEAAIIASIINDLT